MAQMRYELDLSSKTLGAQREANVIAQHFDGHLAIVLEVASEVHGSHSTVT
jgi:hypothetical protein